MLKILAVKNENFIGKMKVQLVVSVNLCENKDHRSLEMSIM